MMNTSLTSSNRESVAKHKNADVLALLHTRNDGSINHMADYWTKLLSV